MRTLPPFMRNIKDEDPASRQRLERNRSPRLIETPNH
jgi:hypothetical protein